MNAYRFACACGNYDEIVVAGGEPEAIRCPGCGTEQRCAIETTAVEAWDDDTGKDA